MVNGITIVENYDQDREIGNCVIRMNYERIDVWNEAIFNILRCKVMKTPFSVLSFLFFCPTVFVQPGLLLIIANKEMNSQSQARIEDKANMVIRIKQKSLKKKV
jgi:hypothetical protein